MNEIPQGCLGVDEDLSAWIDGELDAVRGHEVHSHVAACARCTERSAALRAVDARLRRLADAAGASQIERLAHLHERLAAERDAAQGGLRPTPRRAPPPRRPWALPAGFVAAAAAAAFAALVIPDLVGPGPTPVEVARPAPPSRAPERSPLGFEQPMIAEMTPVAEPSLERELFGVEPLAPDVPRGASAAGSWTPAPEPAPVAVLASASGPGVAKRPPVAFEGAAREDLALALSLRDIEGLGAMDELAMIEQLDVLERLEALAGAGGR